MGLLSVLRKSYRVNRIARILGTEPTTADFAARLSGTGPRLAAERDLFDMARGNNECLSVLSKHGLDASAFEECYAFLLATGPGQWAGAHYVPVSVLVYAQLLDHLLTARSQLSDLDAALSTIQRVHRGRFE
jgi:hypothetical protein